MSTKMIHNNRSQIHLRGKEMVQLNGKVAIVTGGAKGIGKAITVALAQEGAKVVINYNSSKEAAENLVNELGKDGHDVYAVQADVSKVEDANRLVEETVNHFGKVDILVNNAGITRDRTFKKLNREDWERVIDVNLSSVFNTTSAVLPYITEAEEGRIISISSIIGQAGGFTNKLLSSKSGYVRIYKIISVRTCKTNVTVNAICPGFIDTEMVAEVPEEVRQKSLQKSRKTFWSS